MFDLVDDVHVVEYKIFINDQPPNLPLDHVGTLQNSFKFWEDSEFTHNGDDGKKVIIKFVVTNLKTDASAWVTWVVRDLGEGRAWPCQYRTWCSRSCPW